jgi:hypothetical protein
MEEVPPPPLPVGQPRQYKRCSHNYLSKWHCPICFSCSGGHLKVKGTCVICDPCIKHPGQAKNCCKKCTVVEYDELPPEAEQMPNPMPAAKRGEKCPHVKRYSTGARSYSSKVNCPICSDCGHGAIKTNCKLCSNCGHDNVKARCVTCYGCRHKRLPQNCSVCSDCGHGKLRMYCDICKDAKKAAKLAETISP